MFQLVLNFINYWYFRYLLVTELYMVEKWERAMFPNGIITQWTRTCEITWLVHCISWVLHLAPVDGNIGYIVVLILLSVLYLFNTTIMLGVARMFYNSLFTQEALKKEYVYEEL